MMSPQFMPNKQLSTLGENIRRQREILKLTQEALAERCNLHRTYVCDIERGTRNVTFKSLLKLASGLNTTVSELAHDIAFDVAPFEGVNITTHSLRVENTTMKVQVAPTTVGSNNRLNVGGP